MSAARRRDMKRTYRIAALIAGLGLLLAALVVFVGRAPLSDGYRIRGVLSSVNQLKPGSEVRIAGVRVGEVTRLEKGRGGEAIAELRIDDHGRPVRTDATLAVKPRLLLEGNAYVDLSPGTPNAVEMPSGGTIPLARTSVSTQLDQVLTTFDLPTRDSLHRAVDQLAEGLGRGPGGRTGYGGLRRSVRAMDEALGDITVVARALRGPTPGRLAEALGATGDVTGQVAERPRDLAGQVSSLERLTAALAADEAALADTVAGLARVARAAPRSLTRLDRALPELTRFADALRPGLRAAPRALRRTNTLFAQIAGLVREPELGRIVGALEPLAATLPGLERRLGVLFRLTKPVTDCLVSHVVPTANMEAPDGRHSTGDPVWLDAAHMLAGFASISSAVDANGGTVRLGVTEGDQAVEGVLPGLGRVAGYMPARPLGVRPTWLGYGVEPPYRPDQECADQALPDLGKRSGPPPDWGLRPAKRKRVLR